MDIPSSLRVPRPRFVDAFSAAVFPGNDRNYLKKYLVEGGWDGLKSFTRSSCFSSRLTGKTFLIPPPLRTGLQLSSSKVWFQPAFLIVEPPFWMRVLLWYSSFLRRPSVPPEPTGISPILITDPESCFLPSPKLTLLIAISPCARKLSPA